MGISWVLPNIIDWVCFFFFFFLLLEILETWERETQSTDFCIISVCRFLFSYDFEQISFVFCLHPPTHPLTIRRWCSESFSGYLVMAQLASLSLLFMMKVVMVQHFVSKEGLLEGYVWPRHSIVIIVFPFDLFVVCGDFLCNFIATYLCTNPLSSAPLSGADEVSVGVMAVSGDFFAIS